MKIEPATGEVTRLLALARAGNASAWNNVVTLLYDELLQIARQVRGGKSTTLNPTALVNECYLRVAHRCADGIENRAHFLAIAARAMRQILVNYARDRMAGKRGGGVQHVTLDEQSVRTDQEARDVLALDEAMSRLAAADVRLVQIVDCRVFAGMSESETANALDLSLRTVQRYWSNARAQLHVLLAD